MQTLLSLPFVSQLLNPWVLFGFTAQAVFFGRFIVQLWASEKARRVVVPVLFWYLSILGAAMILVYSIYRQDIVFITGQVAALIIYIRNLKLHWQHEALEQNSSPVPN
jgi:lipid-A-disaccharide synthase-like uncharacterized protein